MRIGSLFSGYGGLDLAVLDVLGGDIAWHVEYDRAPSRILAHHYPDVPNHGDVTRVDFTDIEPVDVITGGYPCQPFSHAGLRKGTNDERHLWPHVLRAICEMGPRLAILENVRGHLSLGFTDVLADLADIGWSAEWCIVRASDAGACHQRARLFILAYPGDADAPTAYADGLRYGPGKDARRVGRVESENAGSARERQRARQVARDRSVTDWGEYEAAVCRWEHVTGREAPHPTENDDHGGNRLAPRFAEWMMGLPDGWVTDPPIGISRSDQLKALGNGVVPQQAALALDCLLPRITPALPEVPS